MPRFYDFAIIRIAPDDVRDERINIGVAIFQEDGLDVRLAIRTQKLRAISGVLTAATLQRTADLLQNLDASTRQSGSVTVDQRYTKLTRVGMLSLSRRGQFVSHDAATYEARVASLLRSYVEAEASPRTIREKRSGLLTLMKQVFRNERILALKDEGLASHRIVPKLAVADGLVADLALKNSVMHVIETVDAPHGEESLGKVIGDVAVSALVLERARLSFGADTKPRLVYSASSEIEPHVSPSLEVVASQGIELVNWQSEAQQKKFLVEFAGLAIPREQGRRGRARR